MPFALAAVLLAAAALAHADGSQGRAAATTQPAAGAHRAVLLPTTSAPLRVRGSGFRGRESVRVTVTPSSGYAIVRRIRATSRGTFALTFAGVDPCGGVEGVAAGSRGSHASFQLSSGLSC
jgi:hypothetical protein